LGRTHKSLLIALALLAALALAACGPARPQVKTVTPLEVHTRLPDAYDEGLILLDVRTLEEWTFNGHIDGATLIPLEQLPANAASELPDKDAEIIVYCNTGNKSAQAAEYLVENGYTNVSDMGGLQKWVTLGYPLVTDP
jgi:phage shock protein E